jgi:hypothetical protein
VVLDEQTNNRDFVGGWNTVSFEISGGTKCRFFRLTQKDRNHHDRDKLVLRGVEFFGTLYE